MSILADRVLLERLQAGDAVALEVLFERYEGPLFQFLYGLLRDRHAAEDALQESFLKTLTESHRIDGDRFRGWLYTVAFREAMQARRKQKRRPDLLGDTLGNLTDPLPSVGEAAVLRDQTQRVRTLLEQLPKPQRDVIRARIFEGKRFREIANEVGCPLNTALARMHEGLKKLRSLMGEENHD